MVGVVVGLIVIVCLVGGLFYGYSYLKAKVNKTSVNDELIKNVNDVINKKSK